MKDTYGREITYLRLSVTDLCNLRCRYCMPEEGVRKLRHEDILTEDEMISAVEAAAALGVWKLRITGGEPLLKKNLLSICRRASAVEGIRELCLTTNGTLLRELAVPLREAGVQRLNISLDTLRDDVYARLTRGGSLHDALDGLSAALEADFTRIKLNAVLLGGWNEEDIRPLAELTQKYPLDVRFIERMPLCADCVEDKISFLPGEAVLRALPELEQEETDGAAQLYRLPQALGRIGLIAPLTAPFCQTCNRLRLTADGHLKPCLHGAEEFTVKGLSGEEMRRVMRQAILAKPPCHTLSPAGGSNAGRTMNQIGG